MMIEAGTLSELGFYNSIKSTLLAEKTFALNVGPYAVALDRCYIFVIPMQGLEQRIAAQSFSKDAELFRPEVC